MPPNHSGRIDDTNDADPQFAPTDDRGLTSTSTMERDGEDAMSTAAMSMGGGAQAAVSDAVQPEQAGASRPSSSLASVIEQIAQLVPESAADKLATLKDQALAMAQSAADSAAGTGRRALQAVKNHPMKTTLVGVGAAALTWWIIARRRAA